MKSSSRPQQKGPLGGALPGTWKQPALMCNCLMEQLGVLSESSKPLQYLGVFWLRPKVCSHLGEVCPSFAQAGNPGGGVKACIA